VDGNVLVFYGYDVNCKRSIHPAMNIGIGTADLMANWGERGASPFQRELHLSVCLSVCLHLSWMDRQLTVNHFRLLFCARLRHELIQKQLES